MLFLVIRCEKLLMQILPRNVFDLLIFVFELPERTERINHASTGADFDYINPSLSFPV